MIYIYIHTRISIVIPVDHLLNNSHDGTSTHQDLATLFSEADKASRKTHRRTADLCNDEDPLMVLHIH